MEYLNALSLRRVVTVCFQGAWNAPELPASEAWGACHDRLQPALFARARQLEERAAA
jgi:hypothetical protein